MIKNSHKGTCLKAKSWFQNKALFEQCGMIKPHCSLPAMIKRILMRVKLCTMRNIKIDLDLYLNFFLPAFSQFSYFHELFIRTTYFLPKDIIQFSQPAIIHR